MSSPLVIGGTGGSGTRVVARIARLGGRYMGSEQNETEDCPAFARFDWRWGLRYLQSGPDPAMAEAFDAAVAEHLDDRPAGAPWGWKHPQSYLLLPFIHRRFPEMKFVHVVRDGRDLAFSDNQLQLNRYGSLLGQVDGPPPVKSAAWWAWANVRVREVGSALGANYLLVRLEDLCAEPATWCQRVLDFSGGEGDGLAAEVERPPSLGRWREHDGALLTEVERACGDALQRFDYV
jgi:hypothetical protein